MNLIKKIAAVLVILAFTFSIAACGNAKEKTNEETQKQTSSKEASAGKISDGETSANKTSDDKTISEGASSEKKTNGKTFLAEDLVTRDEISEITGVTIVDIKLWDNDYMGLLGATYLVKEGGSDGFTLNCYQQSYCGATNDDVEHPVLGNSVKEEYERLKSTAEKNNFLEVVEGLGQDAYYNNGRDTLHVLYNDDYYLEVRDNCLDDPAKKKEIHIKIMKKALDSLAKKL